MKTTPALLVYDASASGAEALAIDEGLGKANDEAAPLHEVLPIACYAKDSFSVILGGAIGRSWGVCSELQQLWVHESHRRRGIGSLLLRAFEERAQSRGCSSVFLENFSFQAPHLYLAQGYQIAFENHLFPHAIVKFHMFKNFRFGVQPNQG